MSSGKTETLGLNQWQLSDAFLMEEMNEDNRRVDAAVAAVPYVKLMDVTTSVDAQQVDLNLSAIDFSNILSLVVYTNAMLKELAGDAGFCHLFAMANDAGGLCSATGSTSSASYSSFVADWHISDPQFAQNSISVMKIDGLFPRYVGNSSWLHIESYGVGRNSSSTYLTHLFCAHQLSVGVRLNKLSFFTADSSVKPGNSMIAGSRFVVMGVKA